MPLLWVSLAFLSGLLLGQLTAFPPRVWMLAVLAAALVILLEKASPQIQSFEMHWRRWSPVAPGVLLAALCLGGLRISPLLRAETPQDLPWYNDSEPVRIVARLVLPPEPASSGQKLTIEAIGGLDGLPESLEGRALVYVPPGRTWRFGDRVEIQGVLETPEDFNGFAYKEYLNRKGIKSIFYYPRIRWLSNDAGFTLMTPIYALRNRAYEVVNAIFPQPEASLLSGILLGLDHDLPEDLKTAFQKTGTAHIIAISGFNIAILVGVFTWLAARLIRRLWSPLLAGVGILFYTLLVGAEPSVVRAAIMGGMGLFGMVIGRRQAGVNSLAFTAALMALFDPWLPWEAGFQLSFTATLGLIWFADPFQQGFLKLVEGRLPERWVSPIVKVVSEYFLFTLAAQIASFPVTVYHFGRFSLTSLLANLLVLPPQPLVMILGGITAIAGMIYFPLGQIFGWFTWPLAAYSTRIVTLLAQLPGVAKFGGISGVSTVLVYAAMAILVLKGRAWMERWRTVLPNVVLGGIVLVAIFVWRVALSNPDGRFHVTAFNLKDGPALLVRMPAGQTLLFGGGSDPAELTGALEPFLAPGLRTLDVILVEGNRAKTSYGLEPILKAYQLNQVWLGSPASSSATKKLMNDLRQEQVKSIQLEPGQRTTDLDGATIEALDVTPDGAVIAIRMERLNVVYAPATVKQAPPALREFWDANMPGVQFMDAALAAQAPAGWQTIAFNQPVSLPSGDSRWISLDNYAWVTITSDGERLWASGK